MHKFSLALVLLFCCGCAVMPPDVDVCVEISPIEGFCVKTISGERHDVNDTQKLNGRTWWEQRPAMIQMPADSWAEIKKYIIKMCRQTKQCDSSISSWERTLITLDNELQQKIPEGDKMIGLKKGSSGAGVEKLQTYLKARGFPLGVIDGRFGDRTVSSLMAFQKSVGLPATGVVDEKTQAELQKQMTPPVSGKGNATIPFAVQNDRRMTTRGNYAGGYARGVLVHFTAGAWKSYAAAKGSTDYGVDKGYAFLNIAYDGRLIQANSILKWGYHAGESAWKRGAYPLIGSVSDDLVGVEMANPGILTKKKDGSFVSYFGAEVDSNCVRHVTEKEYGCPTGYYMKYSQEQEDTLVKTILWLKENDPVGRFQLDNVLAHHEVSGLLGIGYFRKNDCGGALSMPMADFRAYLKRLS